MAVSLINPEGHVQVPIYHDIAMATGGRQVHIARPGRLGRSDLVDPGDLAGQVAQVYRNVAHALEAAGATFHDVVRISWYAAGWRKEMYEAFNAGIEQTAREFDLSTPPQALIGVEILFEPGILIEAEVTAVIEAA